MISRYNEFLLEKGFQSLLDEMFLVLESEGKWTSDTTYEWDFTNKEEDQYPQWMENLIKKAKEFVNKLPKEKIKEYFIRLLNGVSNFPEHIRKKLILGYLGVFLTVANIGYLTSKSFGSEELNPEVRTEIEQLSKTEFKEKEISKESFKGSSFEEAQRLVKTVEAGYSDDRGDTGNWIDIPGHGKRFVGTNHGISAPVLKEWLGRYPKKEDMMNLSYEDALSIYKKKYWTAQNLSEFENQSIANIIYDGCVNQGIGAMSDILINAYKMNGLKISESPFSKSSIESANKLDQEKLFQDIKDLREKKYRTAKTWKRHGKGWLNRLDTLTYNDSENKTSDLA